MKVLLAAHGYPPELTGGTENTVQRLARALARRGLEVVVVAGSMDWERGFRTSEAVDADPASGARVRVLRIHRADLYFDHWQKSASAKVARAFREVLRAERPDVVHVHHWIRLSRDLVACAAREGVPAVVTLHDLWTTCLIAFRVRTGTQSFCEAPLAPDPCLACAEGVPPRTPWVAAEERHRMLHERRADLLRELTSARAVLVPSRAHARAVERFLGEEEGALAARVVAPGRELELPRRDPPPWPDPAEPEAPLRLGAWGHLTPLKGADLLIDALRRARRPERLVLELAGGEVMPGWAEELRARARGLAVRFHGAYELEELAEHPATAVHAMVSGTRAHESWGMVVDEALQLGLACVLPASGAFAERMEGAGWALGYAPGDPAALARVLDRLVEEPALLARLRAAIPPPEDVVPGMDAHVGELLSIYDAAARAGAPPIAPRAWFEDRMRDAAEEAWDESLSRRSAGELGL